MIFSNDFPAPAAAAATAEAAPAKKEEKKEEPEEESDDDMGLGKKKLLTLKKETKILFVTHNEHLRPFIANKFNDYSSMY